MSDTKTDEIELGTQVTTPYGCGIVTWVEIGADEFQVLMYDTPGGPFAERVYKTVDRAHIAFWPPRPVAVLVPAQEDKK